MFCVTSEDIFVTSLSLCSSFSRPWRHSLGSGVHENTCSFGFREMLSLINDFSILHVSGVSFCFQQVEFVCKFCNNWDNMLCKNVLKCGGHQANMYAMTILDTWLIEAWDYIMGLDVNFSCSSQNPSCNSSYLLVLWSQPLIYDKI